MKVRVIYKPDGSVSIIYPTPKSRKKDESEKDWLKRVFERAIKGTYLEGLPYDDVDISGLPDGNYNSEALVGEKGKGVWIDDEKAKKIKEEEGRKRLIENEKKKVLEELALERLRLAGKIE